MYKSVEEIRAYKRLWIYNDRHKKDTMIGHKKRIFRPKTEVEKLAISLSTKEYFKTHGSNNPKGNFEALKKGLHKKRRPFSLEHRRKMSEDRKRRGVLPPSQKGRRPWNYKGITELVESIRKHPKYIKWRKDIFERDDYTCVVCNERGGILNAHHTPKTRAQIFKEYNITTLEEALSCEILWDVDNGKTTCRRCHSSIEGRWRDGIIAINVSKLEGVWNRRI